MSPRRRIIPVFIPHLGCPQNCVFCNQKHISGQAKPVTGADAGELIENGLKAMPQDAAFEIAFYGGSFTAIPVSEQEELLSTATRYTHRLGGGRIRLSTRPDCIDVDTLLRLRRFGVHTIELGSQSMDNEVLALSNRGHSAEDTQQAAQLIKEFGFELILQMMTGLPGDSFEKALESAKRIAALKPDGVRLYPTVIVRDTPLYDMWKMGQYREHSPAEAAQWCSELLDVFDEAGIPVIRLGLNPSDDLSGGQAAGGAYHPALGEMARSVRYLKRAQALLCNCRPGSRVVLGVAPGQISAMTGQKRTNITALIAQFGLRDIKITETDIEKGKVILIREEKVD